LASLLPYDYDPSRSSLVPLRLLQGYQGYVMTDGYDGQQAGANRWHRAWCAGRMSGSDGGAMAQRFIDECK
jgi:hypothetical protein